ncbi:hypothetical protein BC937DRAFT_89942 [Endogone sp. FLAS-F59071]|nr:hypothetical protein BC937DRAFT_89942 [Endogone sp. FLAS-F59071]|eukprot:RUS17462.1 hypothetical protein BC937DRAFT_89942 [Endogone sp. FLAS-F59071]
MKGHANCVSFVKKFNLPTLVLGGGGYTMRNVSRAWAYETGVVVGQDIGPDMPYNDYYEYFGPDYKLDVRPSNMENMNSSEYLEKIKIQVFENLGRTQFAPSVQMQEVPADKDMSDDEDADNPDVRVNQRLWDRRIVPENEYYDSDEGETDSAATKPVRNEQAYRPSASDLVESLNGGLVSAVPQAPPGLMSVVLEKRKAAELDRDDEEEEEMEELLRDDERKRILLAAGIETSETVVGGNGNGNGSGRAQVESEREGPQGTASAAALVQPENPTVTVTSATPSAPSTPAPTAPTVMLPTQAETITMEAEAEVERVGEGEGKENGEAEEKGERAEAEGEGKVAERGGVQPMDLS